MFDDIKLLSVNNFILFKYCLFFLVVNTVNYTNW